jgi:hypothetical protein
MTSPSIYVAENYIYGDKSYTGSFPIYLRDACELLPPLSRVSLSDLDEENLMIAAEENTVNRPRIINSENTRQGLLYSL